MSGNKQESRDLVAIVFVRTFWTFLVALGLVLPVVVLLSPRSYVSEAKIEIFPNTTNAVAGIVDPHLPKPTPQWVAAEVEFLNSPELLKAVMEDLQLSWTWGRKYNNGTPLSLRDSVRMLVGRTEIFFRRGAPVITIRAFSDSPDECAQLANSFIENYRNNFQAQRHMSSRVLQWAHAPATSVRPLYLVEILWALMWSVVLASLAATIVSATAVLFVRLRGSTAEATPKVPAEKQQNGRFQKY